ncbi:hypothetical protein SDC9_179001 [bioreactor metagenome]|uniref:Uncharacterized protein n=1 Tax=bioreactor metagenome TaxID=1076179 RepID=A0A645GXR4_9ZZZZ
MQIEALGGLREQGAQTRGAFGQGLGLKGGKPLGGAAVALRRIRVEHADAGDGARGRCVAQHAAITVPCGHLAVQHDLRKCGLAGFQRGAIKQHDAAHHVAGA